MNSNLQKPILKNAYSLSQYIDSFLSGWIYFDEQNLDEVQIKHNHLQETLFTPPLPSPLYKSLFPDILILSIWTGTVLGGEFHAVHMGP